MNTTLDTFADFFHGTGYEDIPAPVIHRARWLMLDLMGVTVGGLRMTMPRVLGEYLAGLGGKAEAALIGHGIRVPAIHAALGNGSYGHALDMDDGYRYGGVHSGVATIPAAMAMAEARGSSGRELLRAIVLGYEIINRLSRAMNPSHLGRGFHTTGTLGALGAAAACAVLCELDRNGIRNALGLAALQGAGLLEVLHAGAMAKPIHPGKAAMAGVLSAEMAARGVEGPASALDGQKGLFRAMADQVDHARIFDGLGQEWTLLDQYIKFHAACRHIHPAIDALLNLQSAHGLHIDDIDSFHVNTYPVAISFCGTEGAQDTAEGAKFSLPSSLALAARFGDAGEERFAPQVLQDEAVSALAPRVTWSTSSRWADAYPRERGATLTVHMKNGRRFDETVVLPKGEPENPASEADLLGKFQRNTASLSTSLRDELSETLLVLDQVPIDRLSQCLQRVGADGGRSAA